MQMVACRDSAIIVITFITFVRIILLAQDKAHPYRLLCTIYLLKTIMVTVFS